MKVTALFTPKPTLSERDIQQGLRWMTYEGIASMGFSSVAGGAILAAFALILGANTSQIGILAAIPPLAQPLQLAAILLVEKVRRRKLIAVASWVPAQAVWILIALIPILIDVPSAGAVSLLLGLMGARSVLSAFTSCSWNGWVKDLVPQNMLARFFARRQALANLTGMIFGLGAAFFADYWQKNASPGDEALGYTFAILAGAVLLGLASPVFMTLMPEPLMQAPAEAGRSIFSTLTVPLRDVNYRRLLRFLLLWWFSISLATPFFAVYMLDRIGLSISTVMILSMVGMAANILFLRVWGRFADRFSNKTVLSVSASLYLLVILGWVFTTMPERYFLTMPLLIVLQIMAGIAGAGVGLTIGTIGMKLAPEGQATSYLATAGLASSIGAAAGPLLGGTFAQFFSTREFAVNIDWVSGEKATELPALSLTGFDFLFGIAFLLGLVTLNMLSSVREEGEVGREVVLDTLSAPMRELARPISSIPGVNYVTDFPFGYLKRVPLPGLDVAVGITAHQIAETARMATVAALRGQRASAKVADSLADGLTQIGAATTGARPQARFEVARQAVRGAVHAVDDVAEDVGSLSESAISGVVRALKGAHEDVREYIRGAVFGAVQGAQEAGQDPAVAATRAQHAARDLAREMGIGQQEAANLAKEVAIQAGDAMGTDTGARVRGALESKESTMLNEKAEPGKEPGGL